MVKEYVILLIIMKFIDEENEFKKEISKFIEEIKKKNITII